MRTAHIAFGDSTTGSLKYILSKNRFSKYDGNVINFPEDLSVGPLSMDLSDRSGFYEKYLKDLRDVDYKFYYIEQALRAVRNIKDKEKFTLVIWHGNNVIEQMALRFIANFLPEKTLIYEISVPVFKQEGLITKMIKSTAEFSPEELFAMLDSNEMAVMTKDRRAQLISEYEELMEDSTDLRIIESGKIKNVKEDHYDAAILRAVQEEFISASRIIGNVMAYSDQVVSDAFIEYRLRALIAKGKVEYKGTLDSRQNYEVKG